MSRPLIESGRFYWIRTGEGRVTVGVATLESGPGWASLCIRGDLSERGAPDALDIPAGTRVGEWISVRNGNRMRYVEVLALIAPPKGATGRSPAPGETWLDAVYRRPAQAAGACCFCNRRILPGAGNRAVRGREEAHYDCAPGLGIEVLRG